MSRRAQELVRFSPKLWWFLEADAALVFTRAEKAMSRERYGLDENTWEIVARWDVEKTGLKATRAMLAQYLLEESLLICFGRKDVCRLSRSLFLDHWQDMFIPSRDDVLIMSESCTWAAFYCHEDEFEIGRPKNFAAAVIDSR